MKEYAEYRHLKVEDLYEVLDSLQESARDCRTIQEWFDQIERYTEKLAEQKQQAFRENAGVTVSTLHSVKGLEYSHVYILDVNEGNIPYKKALTEEDLEEERRMFYVGMTRAKERLHLLYTRKQNDRKAEISRFLNEIQEEQPCAEKPLPSGRKR